MPLQDLVPALARHMEKLKNRNFSFDFRNLCGKLNAGRTQAAYLSVKGAAASTPLFRKWNDQCRATQICTKCQILCAAFAAYAGLRMQAHPAARAPKARAGFAQTCAGRAIGAAWPLPALFHTANQCLNRLSAAARYDSRSLAAGRWTGPEIQGASC